jgi:hypothetical protein
MTTNNLLDDNQDLIILFDKLIDDGLGLLEAYARIEEKYGKEKILEYLGSLE